MPRRIRSHIQVQNNTAKVEHEASTSKIGKISCSISRKAGHFRQDAISMMISGSLQGCLNQPPMEFAVGSRQVVEPEAGRKCWLIVVVGIVRIRTATNAGETPAPRAEEEKREMIVENSELCCRCRSSRG